MSAPIPTIDRAVAALRRSQARLSDAVAPLDADGIRTQSYADDWSVAQVVSHLGSQADIFDLYVTAAITGEPVPGIDAIQPIWDAWNAKTPEQQVADGVARSGEHIDRVAGLSADELDRWHLDLFGTERSYLDTLLLRLSEHAVHTWDVVVALEPSATLEDDAAELLAGRLGEIVGYVGRSEAPLSVAVHLTDAPGPLVLELGPDSGSLAPAAEGAPLPTASVTLSADALIRLVYGRLDPAHTPSTVKTDGVELDTLRAALPGV